MSANTRREAEEFEVTEEMIDVGMQEFTERAVFLSYDSTGSQSDPDERERDTRESLKAAFSAMLRSSRRLYESKSP